MLIMTIFLQNQLLKLNITPLTRLSTGFFCSISLGDFLIGFFGGIFALIFVFFIIDLFNHLSRPESLRIKKMFFPRVENLICKTQTGLWQINMKTGSISINAEMPFLAQISHEKKHRKIDLVIREIFHPEDWALAEEKINSVLNGKEPYFLAEIRVKSRTNGYFWTMIRGTVLKKNRKNVPVIIGGTLQDISIRKERELEIQRLSYFDALTGLKNRRAYESAVIEFDTAENLPISIISTDLNGLKIINDAFGHNVGDQLLVDVANTLRSVVHCNDCIFRIGGDEFVIISPKTIEPQAKQICESISEKIDKLVYHGIQASISIGYKTKDNLKEDLRQLLINAEVEMYHSKLQASWKNKNDVIRGIQTTLFKNNPELKEHSTQVSEISYKIGIMLALSNEELSQLRLAAEFHDIGKIAVEKNILSKYLLKDEAEDKIYRQHVEYGYRLLSAASDYDKIAKDVLFHHEHWDGTGYPKGLKGTDIPLFSRIIHLAEAVDWMSRKLPYRKPFTKEKIKSELLADAGKILDPELCKLYISAFLR